MWNGHKPVQTQSGQHRHTLACKGVADLTLHQSKASVPVSMGEYERREMGVAVREKTGGQLV